MYKYANVLQKFSTKFMYDKCTTKLFLREAFKKKTVKRVTLSLLGLEPTYPT